MLERGTARSEIHAKGMAAGSRSRGLPARYGAEIDERGFAVAGAVLGQGTMSALLSELDRYERSASVSKREQVYAIRNLLEVVPVIRELAGSERVRRLVEPVLGPDAFPVQGIFFDKPAEVNWKVPWHQDLTIPVQARVEVPGFGPWSLKGGVPHVQAPAWLLERMLIVRLHLDASTAANGPLRVIPGSHRHGRLDPMRLRLLREESGETTCLVPRGGALLMRPLLVHASSAAEAPGHRRVIHLEYAVDALPDGLAWYH
jgi:ectoine hydroxylase-related dioxygenase (phytanoyl-CoA dioxygenase family)